jgi:hypothetical protein
MDIEYAVAASAKLTALDDSSPECSEPAACRCRKPVRLIENRAMLLIDVDLWNGGQSTVASALEAESDLRKQINVLLWVANPERLRLGSRGGFTGALSARPFSRPVPSVLGSPTRQDR